MSGDFDRAVEIVLDSPAMLPHLDAFWAFIDGSMTEDEFRDAMSCDQGYTWEDRAVSLAARLAEVERIVNEMGDGVSPECSGFADQIRAVLDKGKPDER